MKNIITIGLFFFLALAVSAQTPNSLGGVTVDNKGVEDFTASSSAQVDTLVITLIDGTELKVARTAKVIRSNAAPIGTAIADVWIDTLGTDTMYFNNAGTWVRFVAGGGGASNATLDDAYNNFGATASKVTVDAAQSQTGGLEFETGNNTNILFDMQGNSVFKIQDGGVTDVLNVDGNGGEVRVGNNTDQGAFGFQVNTNAFFASTVDLFSNIRDNRANPFFSQSLNSAPSNRFATFGNGTYSDLRFTFKRMLFDFSGNYSMSAQYGYFFELPTSTSGNNATYIFQKTGTAAAPSGSPGGDYLIEFGAGDGIGRQGRMGIGLGNTAANPTVSPPRRMLDVGGNVSIRGDLYNPGDSTGTAGQIIVKRGTGWGWASTSSALDANYAKIAGNTGSITLGTNNTTPLHLETNNTRRLSIPSSGITASTTASKMLTLDSNDSLKYNTVISSEWDNTVTQSGSDTLLNSASGYGHFQRVGNYVTFTLRIEIALTNSGTTNTFYIDPPVASNFVNTASDVVGVASMDTQSLSSANTAKQRCLLFASTGDDKIGISIDPVSGLTYPENRMYVSVSGSYVIQ